MTDNRIANGVVGALIALSLVAMTSSLQADEIKFGFKNPSFSGVGTSSHYLTIDSQEMSRKEAIEAEDWELVSEAVNQLENEEFDEFVDRDY